MQKTLRAVRRTRAGARAGVRAAGQGAAREQGGRAIGVSTGHRPCVAGAQLSWNQYYVGASMVLGSGMHLSRSEQKDEPALCTGTAVGTQKGEVDG